MAKEVGSLFDLFESFFNDDLGSLRRLDTQPMRHNRLISTSSFPPANVMVDRKTKELYIEVALAGCAEDNIGLSFDSDRLKLVVDVPMTKDESESDPYYIQRGLKKIQQVETSWLVDPRFYDRDTCKVAFQNGLLTIRLFPKEDVRPRKIQLFGNRDLIENKKSEITPES
jgi:HSP20 family molecular chaperone IbpA